MLAGKCSSRLVGQDLRAVERVPPMHRPRPSMEIVRASPHQSVNVTRPCQLIGEHGQCSPTVSRLQSKKQRTGFLDVLFGTTLGGGLEGNRRQLIRPTDESHSFSQASHTQTRQHKKWISEVAALETVETMAFLGRISVW